MQCAGGKGLIFRGAVRKHLDFNFHVMFFLDLIEQTHGAGDVDGLGRRLSPEINRFGRLNWSVDCQYAHQDKKGTRETG